MRTSRGSFPGKRHLLVASALGAFVAAIPAIAAETMPVEAVNEGGGGIYHETPETHRWANASQTVLAGDTVAFRNSTEVPHGVEWRGSLKPTCSGVPVGNTPAASGTKWSGTCTFSQPGTYTFWCTVHGAEMSGTITVNSNGTTTVTPPTTPSTTTTTSPEPAPAHEESLLAGSPSRALKLAASQRGLVRGSIDLSEAAAGGRLEVDLLVRGAVLAKTKHHALVRVGRLVRGSLSPGKLSFAVRLDARARSTLARRRRLALTVKIVLAPIHGKATVLSRIVTERSR